MGIDIYSKYLFTWQYHRPMKIAVTHHGSCDIIINIQDFSSDRPLPCTDDQESPQSDPPEGSWCAWVSSRHGLPASWTYLHRYILTFLLSVLSYSIISCPHILYFKWYHFPRQGQLYFPIKIYIKKGHTIKRHSHVSFRFYIFMSNRVGHKPYLLATECTWLHSHALTENHWKRCNHLDPLKQQKTRSIRFESFCWLG